jgi:hypothetical protein
LLLLMDWLLLLPSCLSHLRLLLLLVTLLLSLLLLTLCQQTGCGCWSILAAAAAADAADADAAAAAQPVSAQVIVAAGQPLLPLLLLLNLCRPKQLWLLVHKAAAAAHPVSPSPMTGIRLVASCT